MPRGRSDDLTDTIGRMHIAIQGALGSFHHQAAYNLDQHASILPKQTFADVFQAVETGEVTHGLCATTNTLHGPINDIYHLLEQHTIWIVRDVQLQIAQHLIGPSSVSLVELAKSHDVRILSQTPALAQVENWLALHLPNAATEATYDTAASVKTVVQLAQPHTLAIAGRLAAETYEGTIVADNIQDNPHNYTRFILFSRDRQPAPNATHGSMILKTAHQPGALARALQAFSDSGCNLTKIDSRPIPNNTQRYAFYIDYELPQDGSTTIMHTLERQGCAVKLLGEYDSAPLVYAI